MQVENNFQDLQIFEDPDVNQICDDLYNLICNTTKEEILVVGSIAKLFEEQLEPDYIPKDIDFVVSKGVFRRMRGFRKEDFTSVKMIERRPERIIFYTDKLAVEVWEYADENIDREKKYYKEKIPYLKYAD